MTDNDTGWFTRRERLRAALRHDGLADHDESRPKVWRAT